MTVKYTSRKELLKMLDANGKFSRSKSTKAKEDTGNMTVAKAHELARMLKMKDEIIAEVRSEVLSEIMALLPKDIRAKMRIEAAKRVIGEDAAARIEQRARDRKARDK
jgi:hypothetical protein